MAARSETYYLQLYRDALTKSENVEELVKLLKSARTVFNDTLLSNLGAVTTAEWREIDERSRGGRLAERGERRARNLIEKVRNKDNLKVFRGLRKFIAKQVASDQMQIIERVFPFGAEEDQAGLAPQIVRKVVQQPTVTPVQSATPSILWITLSRAEFEGAKKLLKSLECEINEMPSQCNLFVERSMIPLPGYSLHDSATLFIACPKVNLSGPDPFKEILTNFSPSPHFALLTGSCCPLPEAELGPDPPNDSMNVVVVTSKTPLPIEGEVQYSTELWRLKGEFKELCVSFGGAAKTMDRYEGCTVYYPKASLFYAAAKQIERLEYLAIAQVHKESTVLADSLVDSYYLYVYNILQNVAKVL